jgi:hypothetical protein
MGQSYVFQDGCHELDQARQLLIHQDHHMVVRGQPPSQGREAQGCFQALTDSRRRIRQGRGRRLAPGAHQVPFRQVEGGMLAAEIKSYIHRDPVSDIERV